MTRSVQQLLDAIDSPPRRWRVDRKGRIRSSSDMHHGWRVCLFALSCLLADIRTHRKARP